MDNADCTERGVIVEICHKDFEFSFDNKPTGHYMRGAILGEIDEHYMIESLSDGQLYRIPKEYCVKLIKHGFGQV